MNEDSVSWQNARLFMPTTTAIKDNGGALANPDSKINMVTNTIGAYYANSNLGMAKRRWANTTNWNSTQDKTRACGTAFPAHMLYARCKAKWGSSCPMLSP